MRASVPFVLMLGFAGSGAYAAPAHFVLSKDHTDVVFEVSHVGYSMKHGWFRDISGTLIFDAKKPESSSVDVTIKSGSIDTNNAQRDKDLSGQNFLDAVKFPDLHFVSTRVVRRGNQTLDVEGSLTLHGITRPIVLHTKLNKSGPNPFNHAPTVGFTAHGSLMRSDYGIASMIPILGDEVSIVIDAEFDAANK
ncbi:MAG: YceI family protein [Steroidobacteraceae bacterium]